jgi:outer membrane lipoprotein-sorting protein
VSRNCPLATVAGYRNVPVLMACGQASSRTPHTKEYKKTAAYRPLLFIVFLSFCLGLMPSHGSAQARQTPPDPRAARVAAFDPRALQLLQEMVAAYTALPSLEQRTEFVTALIPLPPPKTPFSAPPRTPDEADKTAPPAPNPDSSPSVSEPSAKPSGPQEQKLPRVLRLFYQQPNRLRLESQETDPETNKVLTDQWVSDGKTFWTYIAKKNWYTREKTPGRIGDFQKLSNMTSGSLELLMLMGVNPFADLKSAADAVRYEGTAVVRGVTTEVISLQMSSPVEETQARFYIGKDDHLLHRLVHETTPILGPPVPGKVGDGLDELIDNAEPVQPPVIGEDGQPIPQEVTTAPAVSPANRTRVTYDNILRRSSALPVDTFLFTIPSNALLYGTPGDLKPRKPNLKDLFRRMKNSKPRRH